VTLLLGLDEAELARRAAVAGEEVDQRVVEDRLVGSPAFRKDRRSVFPSIAISFSLEVHRSARAR